jgi:cold shock CspA family protein
MSGATLRGVVVEFHDAYGWVRTAGLEQECFLHASDLSKADGLRLVRGAVVEFQLAETPRGPRCRNARLVSVPTRRFEPLGAAWRRRPGGPGGAPEEES